MVSILVSKSKGSCSTRDAPENLKYNGVYTLGLINRRKVSWLHGGSIPPTPIKICCSISVGRELACQARGHGFEPRLQLL